MLTWNSVIEGMKGAQVGPYTLHAKQTSCVLDVATMTYPLVLL